MKILKYLFIFLLGLASCHSGLPKDTASSANDPFTKWKSSVIKALNAKRAAIPAMDYTSGIISLQKIDSATFIRMLARSDSFAHTSDKPINAILLLRPGSGKYSFTSLWVFSFTSNSCLMARYASDKGKNLQSSVLTGDDLKFWVQYIRDLENPGHESPTHNGISVVSESRNGIFQTAICCNDTTNANSVYKYITK